MTEAQAKHDELLERMKKEKEKWAEDSDSEDETDKFLQTAMDLAIEQGKGWGPGEKEAYMDQIMDDDFLPPIFCETMEELEKSGMRDAFTALEYDEPPAQLMEASKKKGNDAFKNGRMNEAKNMQYYRDAINHYYEAFGYAQGVPPSTQEAKDNDKEQLIPLYTEQEMEEIKSTLCSNAAMAHMVIKNWGHVKEQSTKALSFNDANVKAWYRLAKAHQNLTNWEEAGDAIDSGLAVEADNKDLKKLQTLLNKKVTKARQDRQKRERQRAQRAARVKDVWKHCKQQCIQLGRVPLVKSVTDDEEDDDGAEENRWHQHLPHSGRLPDEISRTGEWTWPCMFLYPSHNHSDFVEHFGETEMMAMRMAEMFPEVEEESESSETQMKWDYNNEFSCSNLAVYFEVHCTEQASDLVHPENVERLLDQGSAMRFYEASRALKGDEGPEMTNVARVMERKHLHKQRKAWKKKHKSLWSKPEACPVVRVHPAVALKDVLMDSRMVVPNFLVTFVMFPENHPAHKAYLKEHRCLGLLQPDNVQNT